MQVAINTNQKLPFKNPDEVSICVICDGQMQLFDLDSLAINGKEIEFTPTPVED